MEKLYASGIIPILTSDDIVKEVRTYTKTVPRKKELIAQPSQSNVYIVEFVINKKNIELLNTDSKDVRIEFIEDYSKTELCYHYIVSGRRITKDKIKTLTELNLANCNLVDDNVSTFDELRSLVSLNLNQNNLTHKSLAYFAKLPLESLELCNNKITEIAVRDVVHPNTKQIFHQECIETVLVFSPSLISLALDKNPLNGSCIRTILNLSNLTRLSLRGINFLTEENRTKVMHVLLGCRTDLIVRLSRNLQQYDAKLKISLYSQQQQNQHIFFEDEEK